MTLNELEALELEDAPHLVVVSSNLLPEFIALAKAVERYPMRPVYLDKALQTLLEKLESQGMSISH